MKTIMKVNLVPTLLLLVACNSQIGTDSNRIASAYDVNRYAVNRVACNPMGGSDTPVTDPGQGLHASLWYLQSGQTIYHDVESMIANGHPSETDLFFSELFIPTRLFNEGFPLQSGGEVKDDSGNPLIEYFALRFEGVLHLGPNEAEGDYQLGVLADDGVIWTLTDQDNQAQLVVNDDGDHPTKMGCGPVVHMTHDTQLTMQLDYYQGPRYHIALVPMWRMVNTSQPTDPLCNVNGNSTYFDYNHNSAPQPAFNQLLSRGWYPLGVANYSLQPQASYNPCTTGTPPIISDVTIHNGLDEGYLLVHWTTNILATDQVLITDTGTGVQTLTASDNFVGLDHSVYVTTLVHGHSYQLQAVSISQDLGKTISAPVSFTYN